MMTSQTRGLVASVKKNRDVRRVALERLAAERAAHLTEAAQPPVEYEQQATTGSGETDHINVATT